MADTIYGISQSMQGEYKVRKATAVVLKAMRKERGLRQWQMAQAAGIIQQSYGKYERGLHTPSLHLIFCFAKSLGCEPWEIVRRIENVEFK